MQFVNLVINLLPLVEFETNLVYTDVKSMPISPPKPTKQHWCAEINIIPLEFEKSTLISLKLKLSWNCDILSNGGAGKCCILCTLWLLDVFDLFKMIILKVQSGRGLMEDTTYTRRTGSILFADWGWNLKGLLHRMQHENSWRRTPAVIL